MALNDIMKQQLLNNTLLTWLFAVGTWILVTFVLRAASLVLVQRLSKKPDRECGLFHEVVLNIARRSSLIFQVAMGLAAASYMVNVPDQWDSRLRTGIIIVAILQAGAWGTAMVRFLVDAMVERRTDTDDMSHRTGSNMLRFFGVIVIWMGAALLCLDNLGINVTTLVAGLGVTGVAVALATQNIVGDLFASVSLLLDKPFVVGDFIILDTFMGTVERIGVKTTRLRSLGGEGLVIANSDLTKSRLRNYKTMRERRVVFTFNVSYDTSPTKLAAIGPMVGDVVRATPLTRFDRAHFVAFGDAALRFEVVFYVLDADYTKYMDVQQAINLAICERLAKLGVSLVASTNMQFVSATRPTL